MSTEFEIRHASPNTVMKIPAKVYADLYTLSQRACNVCPTLSDTKIYQRTQIVMT